MRGGGGDQLDVLTLSEQSKLCIPLVGERVELVAELDGDVVAAEAVDEFAQRAARTAPLRQPVSTSQRPSASAARVSSSS